MNIFDHTKDLNQQPMTRYVFLLLFFASAKCFSQKKPEPSFYVFDKKGKGTTLENAEYLGVFRKITDTCFEWMYYHFKGSLINIESFRDEKMTMPHGYYSFFDSDGKMDSSGYMYMGYKHGHWSYYTDSLTVYRTEEYDQGNLLRFQGLQDILAAGNEMDSITALPGDREAALKGGDKAWVKYLQNNFKYPERMTQLGAGGMVLINFTVTKTGELTDIRISKSIEYSFDEEVMRVIRDSPSWEPAIQQGKPVKAYRKQPFTIQN